ncbi:MAG: 2'-5' RNA ligase family protein [Solirubrobacteraceae bacterium]
MRSEPSSEVAVVVPVPVADRVVSGWRERFDASAAHGLPAHITVLYPFLSEVRLTDDVLKRLRELFAERSPIDVWFRRTARFATTLYLEPDPADQLRDLTLAIVEQWPDTPPYGGDFDDVVPHLTVAHGAPNAVLDGIDVELRHCLPLVTRLAEACVYVFAEERRGLRARLPFASAATATGTVR